ncbi:MAG: ubiquinol-cytochrome C chaperone family protein [Ahrensia sp.]
MIMSLFGRKPKNANAAIVDSLYAALINAGRLPVIYADFGVPDTPLGRFESLSAHMIVFLHRTRATEPALEALAQDILDEFFKDVDHSIRELGIGDSSVPKRMKKLGKMFYGRMGSYWEAIDNNDTAALGQALARNIAPEAAESLNAEAFGTHLMGWRQALAQVDNATLLSGRMIDGQS